MQRIILGFDKSGEKKNKNYLKINGAMQNEQHPSENRCCKNIRMAGQWQFKCLFVDWILSFVKMFSLHCRRKMKNIPGELRKFADEDWIRG